METTNGIIEPLFEKVEQYSKTSIELWKLKAINKFADVSSILIAKIIWFFAFTFLLLFLSLAAAFYFGYLLNNLFYGFMIVTLFYMVVATVLVFTQNFISKRIKHQVIKLFINQEL